VGKRSGYVAVIMAFALVLAACSSDDSESFLDQSPAAAADSDDLNPVGDFPTDVGDLPGVSGECEALLNLFLSIGGAFLGSEVSTLDAAALAALPGDIRGDAQLVSETLRQFSVGVQALGVDFADPASFATLTEAQQEEFSALGESLDTAQFKAASDNVSAYGEQQCENEFGLGG